MDEKSDLKKMEYGWILIRNGLLGNIPQLVDDGIKEFMMGYGDPSVVKPSLGKLLDKFAGNSKDKSLFQNRVAQISPEVKKKLEETSLGKAILEHMIQYGELRQRSSSSPLVSHVVTPPASSKPQRKFSSPFQLLRTRRASVSVAKTPEEEFNHVMSAVNKMFELKNLEPQQQEALWGQFIQKAYEILKSTSIRVDLPDQPSVHAFNEISDRVRGHLAEEELKNRGKEGMAAIHKIMDPDLREEWAQQFSAMNDKKETPLELPPKRYMEALMNHVNTLYQKGESLALHHYENLERAIQTVEIPEIFQKIINPHIKDAWLKQFSEMVKQGEPLPSTFQIDQSVVDVNYHTRREMPLDDYFNMKNVVHLEECKSMVNGLRNLPLKREWQKQLDSITSLQTLPTKEQLSHLIKEVNTNVEEHKSLDNYRDFRQFLSPSPATSAPAVRPPTPPIPPRKG